MSIITAIIGAGIMALPQLPKSGGPGSTDTLLFWQSRGPSSFFRRFVLLPFRGLPWAIYEFGGVPERWFGQSVGPFSLFNASTQKRNENAKLCFGRPLDDLGGMAQPMESAA